MKYIISTLLVLMCVGTLQAQDSTEFLSRYEKYWELHDGYYRVMEDGKIGLVNAQGDIIIPTEYNQVWNLQENGNVKVLKDGKLGIYSTAGSIIVPTEYDMIWNFKDGRARVLRKGKIGYVSNTGNEYIPCVYDQIWDFEDGKAKVLKNGSIGFINEQGTEVIPPEYHTIWDFKDGKAKVLKDGRIGIIDEQGLEIVPCKYQQIYDYENGVAKAVLDNRIVYIDDEGNVVEEPEIITNSITVISEPGNKQDNSHSVELHLAEGDTTVLKLFGNKMLIVEDGGTTQLSIGKNSKDEYKQYKKDNTRKFKGHYWGLDLGFNGYLDASGNNSLPAEYSFLDLNSGKSAEVSVNVFQSNIPLSRRGNIGFVTGLGFTFNNYRFANPTIPIIDDNGMLVGVPIEGNLNKNKLTTLYLTAPLLLEYQFSRSNRNAFYISGGAIGGYRLKSHTKVVTMNSGSKSKDKNRSDFALERFRYGAQVRLGYKAINLYATYWMSPLFDTNKGPELYPISIGLAFYPGRW